MTIPLIIFIVSLLLIVALFIVKSIESKRGSELFAAELRSGLDAHISLMEARCSAQCTLSNAFYFVRKLYNIVAHKFAKVTASIAKKVEWRARSVAHKSAKAKANGEEVRENGYLRDVQEHKDSLDTREVAEQAKL